MQVVENFTAGSLGSIVALHGQHYATNWGFGTFFEAKVALELAEFSYRKASNDLLLLAQDEHGIAASLVLDLNDPNSGSRGAHLRWFIASDRCRGTGVGRSFMDRAMGHVDSHSSGKAWLTTFAGLLSARHLYESYNFKRISENEGDAWGVKVIEQEFCR